MELERYLFFDECGDPVNGYAGKKRTAIFFVSCVHSNSINNIEITHNEICEKVSRKKLHYDGLNEENRKIALTHLLNSNLKLDVAISFTNNFTETKKVFSLLEEKGETFKFDNGANYKTFSEMCQTEMYAKLAWLIFADDSNYKSENYQRPLRLLQQANENPIIQFDPISTIAIKTWKIIHLDRQLKQFNLKTTPQPKKSKGTELADILVSGFKDNIIANTINIFNNTYISEFYTTGNTISLTRRIRVTS